MSRNDKLVGGLELAFFGLALLALIVGLGGSPGLGLLLLLLAGAAHVGRAGAEGAGLIRVDGRSRALPILRRAADLTRRGAAAAQQRAGAAWHSVRAARAARSARSAR
jgi:hypothetical protein